MDSAEVSEGVKEIIMLNLCRLFDFVPKEIEIIHDNRDYFRSYTCYDYNKIIVWAEGGEICGDLCQSGECCF